MCTSNKTYVPKFFISVILDWYSNINIKLRWNETLSSKIGRASCRERVSVLV